MSERLEQYYPDFSLDEIKGFDNPHLEEYRRLVERYDDKLIGIGRANNEPYAEIWSTHLKHPENEDKLIFLIEKLKSEVLVDLGSGFRVLQKLAVRAKAKAYVGVDKFFERGGWTSRRWLI